MLQMGDLRFMMEHADSELLALIEETSPPVDLNRVSIFRTAIRRHEKQARDNNNWMDGVLSDRVELKTEDTSFLNLAGRRRAREGGRRDSLLHIHIAVSCDVSLTLWVMLQHFCVCHVWETETAFNQNIFCWMCFLISIACWLPCGTHALFWALAAMFHGGLWETEKTFNRNNIFCWKFFNLMAIWSPCWSCGAHVVAGGGLFGSCWLKNASKYFVNLYSPS